MTNSSTPVLTLADVLRRIDDDGGLSPPRRRDLTWSVRKFGQHLGLDLSLTEANTFCLRTALKGFHPRAAHVEPQTWANIRSGTLAALRHCGAAARAVLPKHRTPEWQQFMATLPDEKSRRMLSRLANWASSLGIAPDKMDDSTFAAFREFLERGTLIEEPREVHRKACRAWNIAIKGIPDWSRPAVTVPNYKTVLTLQPTDFGQPFQQKFTDWKKVISGQVLFDPRAPDDPLAPDTIDAKARHVVRFASILFHSGIPIEQITGLDDLVEPKNFERGFYWMLDRAGGKRPNMYEMANTLVGMARHWLGVPQEQLEKLRRMKRRLRCRSLGLTEKNKDRLRPFEDSKVRQAFYRLPVVLMRRALERPLDQKAALLAETAILFEILMMTALRIGNIVRLELGRHVKLPDPKTNLEGLITIPAKEVKNGVALEFPLSDDTTRLIDIYVHRFRPLRVIDPASPYLMPGRVGGRKHTVTVADQIRNTVRRELGLPFNPHLIRHLNALIWLEINPGDYERLRRAYGHRSLETMMNNYSGTEAKAAVRQFDALILELRREAPVPIKALPNTGVLDAASVHRINPAQRISEEKRHGPPRDPFRFAHSPRHRLAKRGS